MKLVRVIFNEECLCHISGLQKGPLENYQRTNKNLIIETRNEKNIYTELKAELKGS